jgi:curved DNA-binding protein CbpA
MERILDAEGIDELLAGPSEDAGSAYAVLRECALGAAGRCYEAIDEVATRRGVLPSYLVDRADVLLTSARCREEGDLYRVLGVPALASAEEIRDQWRAVVRACDPEAGGERSRERFRVAKAAHDILGDPRQRAEYERVWRGTLAPILAARSAADSVEFEVSPASSPRRGAMLRTLAARVGELLQGPDAAESPGRSAAPPAQHTASEEDTMDDVLRRSVTMLEAVKQIDQRLAGAGFDGVGAVAKLFEQLHGALQMISVDEIDSTLADIDRTRRALDTVSRDLTRLRRLKQSIGDGGTGSGH